MVNHSSLIPLDISDGRSQSIRDRSQTYLGYLEGAVGRDFLRRLHHNGVTGQIDGSVSLDTLPSSDSLCELDEMYDGEFSQALKAGDLSE